MEETEKLIWAARAGFSQFLIELRPTLLQLGKSEFLKQTEEWEHYVAEQLRDDLLALQEEEVNAQLFTNMKTRDASLAYIRECRARLLVREEQRIERKRVIISSLLSQ